MLRRPMPLDISQTVFFERRMRALSFSVLVIVLALEIMILDFVNVIVFCYYMVYTKMISS